MEVHTRNGGIEEEGIEGGKYSNDAEGGNGEYFSMQCTRIVDDKNNNNYI